MGKIHRDDDLWTISTLFLSTHLLPILIRLFAFFRPVCVEKWEESFSCFSSFRTFPFSFTLWFCVSVVIAWDNSSGGEKSIIGSFSENAHTKAQIRCFFTPNMTSCCVIRMSFFLVVRLRASSNFQGVENIETSTSALLIEMDLHHFWKLFVVRGGDANSIFA